MKKNLLKSFQVFFSVLLVTVMCLNLCVHVQAESVNGSFESLIVTSVQSNGTITNGGFSVQYTQISATLKGTNSLDDWSVDQYYDYSWSGNYTFTPANGLS